MLKGIEFSFFVFVWCLGNSWPELRHCWPSCVLASPNWWSSATSTTRLRSPPAAGSTRWRVVSATGPIQQVYHALLFLPQKPHSSSSFFLSFFLSFRAARQRNRTGGSAVQVAAFPSAPRTAAAALEPFGSGGHVRGTGTSFLWSPDRRWFGGSLFSPFGRSGLSCSHFEWVRSSGPIRLNFA